MAIIGRAGTDGPDPPYCAAVASLGAVHLSRPSADEYEKE